MNPHLHFTRRQVLRSSAGLAGLTLPSWMQMRAEAATEQALASAPKAKSCIVLFLWGGLAQQESFDPKPDAQSDYKSKFGEIPTATPGIQFCEHLPLLAKHSEKMAIVRSVHHSQGAHSSGLYKSMTGRDPIGGTRARNRTNWPSLTSFLGRFQERTAGVPNAIRMPHTMYDNGALMAGDDAGWLGSDYDPVMLRIPDGTPYSGTIRHTEPALDLTLGVKSDRFRKRLVMLDQLERQLAANGAAEYQELDHFRQMAADMLVSSPVKEAYDLEQEDPRLRAMYGDHMGGQGLLLARRLTEVGVPVVQVVCAAEDLQGGYSDTFDTHHDHFPKMKERLLPVFDQAASALLTDLDQRGQLDETLVVFLTEFGRTPKINGKGGRDHHPAVYSVAFAGGGIRGGQVYGSSDKNAALPTSNACTPADLHATVYQAMGIDHRAELHDREGRPFIICEGNPLPLF